MATRLTLTLIGVLLALTAQGQEMLPPPVPQPVRAPLVLTVESPAPAPAVPVSLPLAPEPARPPGSVTLQQSPAPAPTPANPASPEPIEVPAYVERTQQQVRGNREFYINPYDADLQTINWGYQRYAYPIVAARDTEGDVTAGWRKPSDMFNYQVGTDSVLQIDGAIRGYFRDDQRIEWSGVERTFGAEAVVRPALRSQAGGWHISAEAEIYLNHRYGRSILSDPERDQYRGNFDVDTFQLFQMYVQARYDDFIIRLGRSRTPFGRYQSPMFTNQMADAPFLRTDVVNFTETGLFFRWQPSLPVVFDFAIVNGEPDVDTNSSPGVVSRLAYEDDFFILGASMKVVDGISSEYQKRYANVYGLDTSVRWGRWLFYGEAMYDEHGFWRDFFRYGNPYNYGPRSIYGRDAYRGTEKQSIKGSGYDIGVAYRGDSFIIDANYGEYFPEDIGDPIHDPAIRRFLLKGTYFITPNVQLFGVGIVENRRIRDGLLGSMNPHSVFTGLQFVF